MTMLDWAKFRQLAAEIGPEFERILGYYREDGASSLIAIEEAARAHDAVALVRPAHKLKGESLQFGAERLGRLAEQVEQGARRCVETRDPPDDLLPLVAQLRPAFQQTLALIDAREQPGGTAAAGGSVVVQFAPRRTPGGGGFGRKPGSFGRA